MIAKLLIDRGANVNALDIHLITPLHLAAYGETDEHYAVAERLINTGANINAINAENVTPLDLARNPQSKFIKQTQ